MSFFGLIARFFSLVAAVVVIAFLAVKYPQTLTSLFDLNLDLIKFVASKLEQPYAGQLQLGMRFINAERALVLVEIMALIKLVLWSVMMPFRRKSA